MQPRPMKDRSHPVPVDSGAILLAQADLVSESTTSRFRPTSDNSHEHLPTGLGVISSPTDLPSIGEVSPPHTILASTTTTSAPTTTTSQPHPTYVLRSTTSASPSAPELSSVRPRPPSADLAPSPFFDLHSPTYQSCPPLADQTSFPPLGSTS